MRRSPAALIACVLMATCAFAQRLPKTATPNHYHLQFTPDLKTARFSGDETIDITVASATRSITLDSAEIEFVTASIEQNGKSQTATVKLDPAKEFAELDFPDEVAPGTAKLHIKFNGILNDKLRGFYLSKGTKRNYATTQFESTDARRAFPSFDEPSYKATFTIALTIDKDDTAISNGSIAKDTAQGDKHTVTFTTTPKMSTYLVAMAVGDWKCSSGTEDGIPIRICSTPDKVELTKYALTSAKQILHFYDNYYAIKYPFHKLDVLAVPDFEAGAMENTAAIFYRESALLIDADHASVGSQQEVFDDLAHEMAHQWFGDLVTMQWWNDIWLNEGFATWMTYKPHEAVHPEWNGAVEESSETANTLTIDSRKTTRPIRQQAETPQEINQLFDGIAYEKAASVLRMVENFIGPDEFRKGVNKYLQENAYGNASAEDFWNTMASSSGKPVDKIMSSFTEQAGAPLLTVNPSCTNGDKIDASQQRFFADKSEFGSAPSQVWTIPLCIRFKDGPRQCPILDVKQVAHETTMCSEGAYFNANGRGFYRTQYSDAAFKALPFDRLNDEERVLLLSDQWALARAGQNSVGNFFDLALKYTDKPDDYVLSQIIRPVQTAFYDLTGDTDRRQYQEFVEKTFSPLLEKIGFEPKAGEAATITQLRPHLVGLLGFIAQDQTVLSQSRMLAERYLSDPNSVDATLAPTVLDLAAFRGNGKLYDDYLAALQKAKTPEQTEVLQRAMLNFSDPQLVQRAILYATTSAVRNQDAAGIFAREIANPATRDIAWPIIKQNWDAVSKQLTISSGSYIVGAAGTFCTPESRADVQQFFAQHHVEASDRALKQSLENIDSCSVFRQSQSQTLQDWLHKHQQ